MDFNCNVKIVDAIMGSGKTSAAINYMNSNDEHFMFITPYLKEVDRIKKFCPSKNFKEPKNISGRKLEGIKALIDKGNNIVSTHALFQKFDTEIIDMCRSRDYTLILDEVTDVIEPYEISKEDFAILKENFVDIDSNTGLLKWRNPDDAYYGKFSEEKRLCELNCLAFYGGSIMMWLFPIEVFNAFRNIYILTYMFNAQIQRYYYDYYGLKYKSVYVTGTDYTNFIFTTYESKMNHPINNFDELIHICEDNKLNMIGDREYDLSKSWYDRNKDNIAMKQLKNNIENYFRNKIKSRTNENLWTCFKDFQPKLTSKGYGRAFVSINMRASNEYRRRNTVVYPVNRYLNTNVKNFFIKHNVSVDEDGFALSEMLQLIWRSSIRDEKEINIYIPSVRMRNLLKGWIIKNSVKIGSEMEK